MSKKLLSVESNVLLLQKQNREILSSVEQVLVLYLDT